MQYYTFSGPADMKFGKTSVKAETEKDARHLAMVARWGRPNGKPHPGDTGPDGRYLSHGLELLDISDKPPVEE